MSRLLRLFRRMRAIAAENAPPVLTDAIYSFKGSPCQLCDSIYIKRFFAKNAAGFPGEWIDHHSSLAVEKCAFDGCQFCQVLLHAIRMNHSTGFGSDRFVDLWNQDCRVKLSIYSKSEPDIQYKVTTLPYSSDGDDFNNSVQGKLRIFTPPETRLSEQIKKTQLTSGPQSEEAFTMIKFWLQDCLENHSVCKSALHEDLPTRVIDVGGRGSSSEPYLHVTKEQSTQKGKYAALSYCWGQTTAYTTTSLTLEERKREIPLMGLPKTLRDAILITRRMGIQYLWVDALCIIQGSDRVARDDWELESAKMRTVYGNAYITIAAASSEDCDGGIFATRCPQLPYCELPFSNDPSEGTVLAEPYREVRSNARDDPLYHRAWTLQERLLSPRVLVFGLDQISWQCQSKNLFESGEGAKVDGFATYRLSPEIKPVEWRKLVQDYTCRDLTDPMDKLPAISGLAEQFQIAIGDDYLAGLWRNQLNNDLLWCRGNMGFGHRASPSSTTRIAAYRAPSWSWAAQDGNTMYHLSGLRTLAYHIEIISFYTTPAGADKFGMVSDGLLTLRGQIKQAAPLNCSSRGLIARGPWGSRALGSVWVDENHHHPHSHPHHHSNASSGPWCLRVSDVIGLILEEVSARRSENRLFRRIGIFHLLDKGVGWFSGCSYEVIEIE